MGTNNFLNKNAKYFLSSCPYIYTCEIKDDFEYSDLKDNLNCEIDNIKNYEIEKNDCYDNERNFCGTYINKIIHRLKEASLIINPIIRSGYYEGCNLDYEIEILDYSGYKVDSIQDLINDLKADNLPYKLIEKSFNKHLKLMVNELEKIFENYSTPLNKIAQFSNGEAVYKQINR